MAANIKSASHPCARKKAMNGPTTASKKRRQSGASRFSSITASARSGSAHGNQRQPDGDLREHHPSAPVSKPLKQRQIDAIYQGRPQKLQRIGKTYPGRKADPRQRSVFIAQPEAERIADQIKRKA